MTVETPRSLLILGGTSWLGGAVARLGLELGLQVTCLARGRSGTVPPGAEHVVADRWLPGAYDEVAGRAWDAVLDLSWQPELVRGATAALAGRTGHWLYVSSVSVYSDDHTPDTDESAPVHDPWQGSGEVTVEQYGPAKVACEQAVMSVAGEQTFVCRPGLIAGYGDPSDRFGYWPGRTARVRTAGEPVLVPPWTARSKLSTLTTSPGGWCTSSSIGSRASTTRSERCTPWPTHCTPVTTSPARAPNRCRSPTPGCSTEAWSPGPARTPCRSGYRPSTPVT